MKNNKERFLWIYFWFLISCILIAYLIGTWNGETQEITYIRNNQNYIQDINSSNYVDFIEDKHCYCIETGHDGYASDYDGTKSWCYNQTTKQIS